MSSKLFPKVSDVTDVANSVLKRYYQEGESEWSDIAGRVVTYLLGKDSEDYYPTYEMILNRYFINNSPALANAGSKGAGLAACFVVGLEDSIQEIFKTKLNFALIAKKGGGCGTTLSNLRPTGANVQGSTHEYAGGPVSFFDTICHDMDVMSQGGFRSMAMMGTMSVYHPDIVEFIKSKAVEGKMATTNISVVVDDAFMEAVRDDKPYETFFRKEDGEILYGNVYMARDIFTLIVEGAYKNGEPGILFGDRINTNTPYKYSNQVIQATNPSLRGGTKVVTDSGIFNIEELVGKRFKVLNLNGEWSEAECFLSGKNKKLFKVKLSGGVEYYATQEHKWAINTNGSLTKVLTTELEVGDLLPVNSKEKPYGTLGNYSDGFFIGWLYGDGWITKRTDDGSQQVGLIVSRKDSDNGIKEVLHRKLKELGVSTIFPERKNRTSVWYEVNINNRTVNEFLEKFGVKNKRDGLPSKLWNEASKEFVLGFLDGLVSSDGHVARNRITITTAHKNLADDLMEFLGFIGIHANKGTRTSENVFGKGKAYTGYDVTFSSKFADSWTLTSKYKNALLRQTSKRRSYDYRSVLDVSDSGLTEDVYDISVYDTTHCFSLANVITGNCGEQPLPKNGMCNLGHLDLSKFLEDDGKIGLERLELAIRLGVRLLDKVIDKTSYPTKEIKQWSLENRPVGLGILGFADYLLKREVAYGSLQSQSELKFLLSFIYKIAEDESIALGKELGVPEACKLLPVPRRNITLLTIAPTGSTSLICGSNEGIEPFFSDVVYRSDSTGNYKLTQESGNNYFRCAISSAGNSEVEVTWKEHIDVLATAQSVVDSGVSKTINFRNDATPDDISNAFIYAWETGIVKGLTIYRNGSREVEVLSTKSKTSENIIGESVQSDVCPLCEMSLKRESGCVSCTNPMCYYSKCEI